MKSPFQYIHRSVETIHDESDRCRIHRHICQIGRHQKPTANIGRQFPEASFSECKFPTRLRIFRHHIRIALRDDNHDQSAENHSNPRPGHTGIHQKLFPGIDKRTPADHAAESQRPDMQGAQLPLQSRFSFYHTALLAFFTHHTSCQWPSIPETYQFRQYHFLRTAES